MHVGRAMMATTLALALALGSGSAAGAAPGEAAAGGAQGAPAAAKAGLPDGWALKATAAGAELTWRAPAPVPVGGAMVQFYAGDRLLGRPWAAKDQRSFRLILDGTAARDLSDLQVRAGGRRLDVTVEPKGAATARASRLAAAPLPPNPVDPGVAGPYSTLTGDYTLPDVQLPGFPQPVEMQGLVVAPRGTTGSRPLVLLLHGKHGTCYRGTENPTVEWPCPAGFTPVPNHRGYQRTQQLLASQGYVTVSISANGVNAQDNGADGNLRPPEDGGAQARSSLVRLHLARWADWAGTGRPSAPSVVQSAPVADMSRVLLMGHSRGGEGVSRAAVDSLTPPPAGQDGYRGTVRWQIRGLALIGPTAVTHNPAPDVPSMTILPGCDGDVADLAGQMYIDATRGVGRGLALHSSVYVIGANHNYFNTEWTPGLSQALSRDDYPSPHDPVCRSASPNRLTPENQQRVGATYVAAAAATFVAGNDQVRPLLDGSGVRAPSADPAIVLTHAIGGNRTPLLVPDTSTALSGSGARLCVAGPAVPSSDEACASGGTHFATFEPVRPEVGRYAVRVSWSSPGTAVTMRPPSVASLANAQSVALRIVPPEGVAGTRLEVAIVDSAGRRATLGEATLDAPPWPTQTAKDWAQEVRLPLTNATAAGLNLSQISSLVLVPRSASGTAVLIDAWGWRPGTPAPQATALPRVDLGELTVLEGNSGTTTYQVPARVSGSGTGQVRVFVVDPATGLSTARLVNVSPGSTTISIPIPVTGNTQPGDGRTYVVAARAVRGVLVGDAFGTLTVQDDDA
ncbi:MAG TPA: hypothetical protein VES42_21670 [Pilimelia sp.]|nr:hypothetical protein [Pilimelia sp.]